MVHSTVPSDAMTSELVSPQHSLGNLSSFGQIDSRLLGSGFGGTSAAGRRRSAGFPLLGMNGTRASATGGLLGGKAHEQKRSSLTVPHKNSANRLTGLSVTHAPGLFTFLFVFVFVLHCFFIVY